MKEKIGNVTLDLTYYPGEDFYSDGAVEDEMLEIAGAYEEWELNGVIADKKSWPILYHFSHIRENIVSWLPFDGTEHVLEIGSGCGAVTGALCDRAETVTCIELSKKRSMMNARRHQDRENLTILVGNFQEIEPTLTEKYDYITLIGVFEYAEAYIQSRQPYVDFLKTIASHLKPEGKIILAIENRFGLKYWAGCTEDHFGTLFEGLEGYPRTKGVKTFTRKELLEILAAAGNLSGSWYYPYPDYKFPMAIHSDRRLPAKGELNCAEYNFDRLRMELFQESAVYDSLLDNDLYPQFANSFLVVIGRDGRELSPVYTRFSNERDRRFSVCTQIGEEKDGARYVKKTPAFSEAGGHVERLFPLYGQLLEQYASEGLCVNACEKAGNGVRLSYLTGMTLEEKLDELLKESRPEEACGLLLSYVEKTRRIHTGTPFVKTPEFTEVFGDVELEEGTPCGRFSNIDLVPANVILGERETVIDYEWTFDFPVPAHFIMYRMIHYYLESDGKRHQLKDQRLYERAGISGEEQKVFQKMEANFQNYMLGAHVPMRSLYEEISPGKILVKEDYEQLRLSLSERSLQVFFDRGQGFCEEDSIRLPMSRSGFAGEIKIPAGTKGLRLDPGEVPGGFCIRRLRWKNGSRASFATNGFCMGEGRFYFGAGDPQLVVEKLPEEADTLAAEIETLKEQEAREEFWKKFAEAGHEAQRLKRELKQRDNVIREMENTKVWKLYRSMKKKR